MGIDALPRNADMLSMMPHLHMTNHVAVLLIVLVLALTTTITFTIKRIGFRVIRNGGSASTPTEHDTDQRLQEAVIEIIPDHELAGAAAMTWSYADCGFEDEFDGGLLQDDGDPDAVWATTTQAPAVDDFGLPCITVWIVSSYCCGCTHETGAQLRTTISSRLSGAEVTVWVSHGR